MACGIAAFVCIYSFLQNMLQMSVKIFNESRDLHSCFLSSASIARNTQLRIASISEMNNLMRATSRLKIAIIETASAQQRQAQPVRNTRADQSTPALSTPGPSHGGGGGSVRFELMVMTLLLLPLLLRRRKS